jgi:hypothetical protein
MNKFLLSLTLSLTAISLSAQTSREDMAADLNKTGGVYYAYPTQVADNTPAPKGYKPFHVSHYGRHGSRYLISDNDYTRVIKLIHQADSANALTPLGKDLLARVDSLWIEAKGRGGDLSPLGRRQHRAIANHLITNYPEAFTKNSRITARSTLVPRCILSMASFCESLKETNSNLTIDMESSNRYMPYLCYSTPESDAFNGKNGWWNEVYRKFEQKNTRPDRLVTSIFSDSDFVSKYVNPHDFMWNIYWLASDAQNTEGKINFYDLFTADEVIDLWQCFNASFYARHSNYEAAEGKHLQNARNLLNNIIETADEAIASDLPSVALRFGHDGNIVPLAALMHIENCDSMLSNPDEFYTGWCDWHVAPMAANIQLIFFRNPKDKSAPILVKILHNEKEVHVPVATDNFPFYRWQDLKAFWLK